MLSISTGAMLGSGIFVLPGLAMGIAGPWVLLSYLLAGVGVLPALLSKAELATAMPVAGGTYVYVDRAMGPWVGTITGLGTWLALMAKSAFALVGLGAYLSLFADPAFAKPVSLCVLAALVMINVVGVGKASMVQTAIVGICLVSLVGFVAYGSASADMSRFEPAFPQGFSGILSGAAFVFVAYAGVTKVCSVAEEVRDPSRDIPRGMIVAHLSVMFIYGIVAWVLVANTDAAALSESRTPIALAAESMAGRAGLVGMGIVSILGLVSMSNAGILSSSRYPFAMGRDGLLPSWTCQLSERFRTPLPSILLTGAVLVLLVSFLPVIKLAKLASGFTLGLFAVNNLALIFLRESHSSWYRPSFRAPFYPWLQCAGILASAVLLAALGPLALSGVLVAVLLGSAWYFYYVRGRITRGTILAHLWGEEQLLEETLRTEREEDQPYHAPRVTTPLYGWESDPDRLISMAGHFVEGGWLEVLRLEELPEQTMLAAADEEDDELMRHLAEQSHKVGEQLHVRTHFRDILTHNAKRAVREHAERVGAGWIVMGWPEPHGLRTIVQNPMAWWLDHAPCDLALYLPRGEAAYARILVLAKPGPHDSLMIHVANRIASKEDSHITLLRMVPSVTRDDQLRGHRDYHHSLEELCHVETASLIVRTDHPESELATLSVDYDLLIMGAQPEHSLRTLLVGSVEHRLAQAARCSVLQVKAPRHKVHTRYMVPLGGVLPREDLSPWIDACAIGHRLDRPSKFDFLDEIGHCMQRAMGEPDFSGAEIGARLRKREKQQSTQLAGGVALLGAAKNGVPTTTLGIFTHARPLPWGGKPQELVDVCIVVLSPHGERQIQLWMLGRLARMVLLDDFLDSLRQAEGPEQMEALVRQADQRIDAFVDESGATMWRVRPAEED